MEDLLGFSEMTIHIKKAVETLEQGGIIAYPTDTAYGLGVDATNTEAIKSLFELKGRNAEKAMHVTVSDIDMAGTYAEITPDAEKLAEAFLPGPLTLVLRKKETIPDVLVGGKNTVGIRIPKNDTALAIVRLLKKPITATSANISGGDTSYSTTAVRESLGEKSDRVDVYVDDGTLPRIAPSTLVDLTQEEPIILREGPITREQILDVLK